MAKKIVSDPTPINQYRSTHLTPEAARAVAEYKQWTKRKHLMSKVSSNAAISTLIERGWQAIQDEESAKKAVVS